MPAAPVPKPALRNASDRGGQNSVTGIRWDPDSTQAFERVMAVASRRLGNLPPIQPRSDYCSELSPRRNIVKRIPVCANQNIRNDDLVSDWCSSTVVNPPSRSLIAREMSLRNGESIPRPISSKPNPLSIPFYVHLSGHTGRRQSGRRSNGVPRVISPSRDAQSSQSGFATRRKFRPPRSPLASTARPLLTKSQKSMASPKYNDSLSEQINWAQHLVFPYAESSAKTLHWTSHPPVNNPLLNICTSSAVSSVVSSASPYFSPQHVLHSPTAKTR
jgi:hypothetical protein